MPYLAITAMATILALSPAIVKAEPITTAAASPVTASTLAKLAEDPADALAKRVAALEDEVNKTNSLLAKLKITGYAQVRYEAFQGAENGLTASGRSGQPDTFSIRRGRVKFAFKANDWSEYVLQPDFSRSGLSLKDVYIDVNEQWTKTHKLRVGQFKVPYGYEIEESSSEREVPERTRWERSLFPNERDRGIALHGNLKPVRYSLAVLNGTGSSDNDSNFKGVDNNFAKQYIARAGYNVGKKLSIGVSGSHNIKLIPAVAAAQGVPGHDDKQYTERLAGIYFTLKQEIPALGELAVKGEYNRGWTGIFADKSGTNRPGFLGAERRAKMLGWHLLVSQFITENNQLAYRIEQFDPDLESRDRECNTSKHAATDFCHFSRVTVHTIAWNYFFHDNLRITSALEIPRHPAWKDQKDMLFTEQVQYKF